MRTKVGMPGAMRASTAMCRSAPRPRNCVLLTVSCAHRPPVKSTSQATSRLDTDPSSPPSIADAEEEDFTEKLKELEDTCSPIISAAYQKSGGPGGADDEEDLDSHDEL